MIDTFDKVFEAFLKMFWEHHRHFSECNQTGRWSQSDMERFSESKIQLEGASRVLGINARDQALLQRSLPLLGMINGNKSVSMKPLFVTFMTSDSHYASLNGRRAMVLDIIEQRWLYRFGLAVSLKFTDDQRQTYAGIDEVSVIPEDSTPPL